MQWLLAARTCGASRIAYWAASSAGSFALKLEELDGRMIYHGDEVKVII